VFYHGPKDAKADMNHCAVSTKFEINDTFVVYILILRAAFLKKNKKFGGLAQ